MGHEADLGFVESPRLPAGLHRRAFAEDELVVVVGPTHPWRKRSDNPSPAELADESLIVRERGSGTREVLERALTRAGYAHGTARLELASTAAIKAAVLAGHGVGVLSKLVLDDDLARERLFAMPVDGIDLRRELSVVWRSGTTLVGPAAELAACAVRLT